MSGLSSPTAMEFAPDGRLFVCQQGGLLRVIKNGVLLTTPFLTLTNVDFSGERGLLGIAFDPNFQTNNFLYVYYTVTTSPIHNRVSRFTANGDVAVPGSELPILDLDNLSTASNHNGGAIHFGPDGKLYVAVGENANPANSQTLTNRLGKMLRINSDGTSPADNPFVSPAIDPINRSIWALGLRNPFTFAFQPNTGRLFINDVGQSLWEEINDGIAGSNYGWAACEGFCVPPNASFRDPLFEYGHGSTPTTGCAIAGGAFYNPPTVQFPSNFVGKYFFADLCTGWIRVMDPSNNTAADFATGISSPVDLKVGADGSLYYLAIGSGAVFRVQFPANQHPTIRTETSTDIAITVDSVTMVRDPFPLINDHNFSSDQHTRVMLFAINADLFGESSSVLSAQLEDASQIPYPPVTVEFVGPVPNASGLTAVIIRLPDGLLANSDVFVTFTLHGVTSNRARFKIK